MMKASSTFFRLKRPFGIAGILFLLVASFALLTFPPAHAGVPAACGTFAGGSSAVMAITDGAFPRTVTLSQLNGSTGACNAVGTMVVIEFFALGAGATGVTDNKGNTWTIFPSSPVQDGAGTASIVAFYTFLKTTDTTLTLTVTGTGTASSITNALVMEFTGVDSTFTLSSSLGTGKFVSPQTLANIATVTFPGNSLVIQGESVACSGGSCTSATMDSSQDGIGGFSQVAGARGGEVSTGCLGLSSSCMAGLGFATPSSSGQATYGVFCTTAANCNNAVMAGFVTVFTSGPSSTGTTTVGSCPTKNTATTTLANNTGYFYEANSLGASTVNTLNSFLASNTLGGATNNNLVLSLYIGTAGQTVTIANPLVLITQHTFTIHQGDKNQPLNFNVGSFVAQANTPYAVMIQGTDKMKINQSGLAGMDSVATSGTTPPATITSLSVNVAQLYLCMNVSFQTIITTTTTSVSTSTVTSTVGSSTSTITTTVNGTLTVTTTQTSIDIQTASGTTIGFVLVILMILLPAMALGGGGALVSHNAGLSGALFISGLAIGAAVGNLAGIVPFYVLAVVLITIVFLILALAIIIRGGGGGE